MKCRKFGLLLLSFLALWLTVNAVSAMPTVYLPPNKTLSIPDGVKLHLGNYYVQSVGTPIHIQKWLTSNWINYSVDNLGTQYIYYPTEPSAVYVDSTHHGVGDGWTYASSLITVTTATGTVCMDFNIEIPYVPIGPQTSSNFDVLFKAYMNGKPLENCQIRITTTVYQDYVSTHMTDSEGKATAFLAVGTYDYHAIFKDKEISGTFQHIQKETIELDLGTGETRQTPTLDKGQILKIGVGVLVIVGAVFAVTGLMKKGRRW